MFAGVNEIFASLGFQRRVGLPGQLLASCAGGAGSQQEIRRFGKGGAHQVQHIPIFLSYIFFQKISDSFSFLGKSMKKEDRRSEESEATDSHQKETSCLWDSVCLFVWVYSSSIYSHTEKQGMAVRPIL